ncbi:MAG: hypothetical protein LQ343_002655 [Gyalolechia ehrenbergii]|nr:MAG: hypothetical protein LQ343_002655 [Gyalolechia ehrenbergii]
MPVAALQRTSVGRNGVGAFILQCKRLDFHYCDWAGSSKGMNLFLQHHLPRFAASHPSIEIHVSPRPSKHPVIRGHYINGTQHTICVRNLEKDQIVKKAEILRDMSGEKARRVKGGRMVGSLNESTRGIWSPFHGAKGPSFEG